MHAIQVQIMQIFDRHPETQVTERWQNIDKYLQRALKNPLDKWLWFVPSKITLPLKSRSILFVYYGKQFELSFELRTKLPREVWELRKVSACCKLCAAGGLEQGRMY